MAGRSVTTEAVVLRSLRFAEADRILHLYTADRGRVGAIAKGARKTRSRFGGRLEPLSHVELVLHHGAWRACDRDRRGARPLPSRRRETTRIGSPWPDRSRGGAPAVSRAGAERPACSSRSRASSTRSTSSREPGGPSSIRSGSRSSSSCCGSPATSRTRVVARSACADGPITAFSPRAGGVVCRDCSAGSLALSPEGLHAIDLLLRKPLADARTADPTPRGAREALSVVSASYEHHGGFRLRTLSA